MTEENESYIGDQSTFAIRYVPGYTDNSKKYFYANCHLVLGGQLIGDIKEMCYLNSWRHSLEKLNELIKNRFSSLSHPEFNNRSDKELFELIRKSNQPEHQYKKQYKYLPVLDNKVWVHCHLSLDETTDAFLILITEYEGKIKFLWEGWRKPCPREKIGKLYSVSIDREFVMETIEKCLNKIEKEYLNYPIR